MGEAVRKLATYDDILQLAENQVGEIINGDLHVHPRPAPKHALASSSLGDEISSPFQKAKGGPGGWWIIDEPELHLNNDILVPDICGWKKERMPVLPETAWFEMAPDWICEILSPSTAKVDRIKKMPLYAHYGVAHLWLIDPELRTLEAYELSSPDPDKGQWVLIGVCDGDKQVSLKPFDVISFSLGNLWDTPC
jgi:Uma2 family endonuclease